MKLHYLHLYVKIDVREWSQFKEYFQRKLIIIGFTVMVNDIFKKLKNLTLHV